MTSNSDSVPDRYLNRPLLVMVENYILDCIGELQPQEQEAIARLVQHALEPQADWRQTLRDYLHFDAAMDEELRELWKNNREIAREHESDLSAIHFARMVVDDNFPELLDDSLGECEDDELEHN
jgi:hypothetical protein